MAEMLTPAAVSPSEPYVAYFSDRDEDASTSCGTAQVSNRPDWMGEMGAKFREAKVGEVVWPGSHDSGAHCEEFDFSKVVHDHWLRYISTRLLDWGCVGQGAKQFASDWSRTQTLSVRQQLEHGIRYIDLRVSKCTYDNEYYIVHSFCGPPLQNVLKDIHEFLSNHTSECLLLDVVPVSAVDHVELHDIIERRLGEFLLKQEPEAFSVSPVNLTISHLMAKGRIILFYKLPPFSVQIQNVLCFWDSRYIHSWFVESLDPSVKESFQLEKFTEFSTRYHRPANERHKNIFHFMYALTPSLGEILKSADPAKYLFSPRSLTRFRSLQDCAQHLNPKLGMFVERVQRHVESEDCRDIGMIVSVDFVEESELMQQVVAINKSKFKSTQIL